MYPAALAPFHTNDLTEMLSWCRIYHFDKVVLPQPPQMRFLIGLYQLRQGRHWKSNGPKWQNYLAAMIHWCMVAESLDMCIEEHIEIEFMNGFLDLRTMPYGPVVATDTTFLDKVMLASQQLIYSTYVVNKSARKARWAPGLLCKTLGWLCTEVVKPVPPEKRAALLHDEMVIMLKDIRPEK